MPALENPMFLIGKVAAGISLGLLFVLLKKDLQKLVFKVTDKLVKKKAK
ncbi:MAG: hypothetical protein J6B48_08160 [Clostridia bacterium]|nr:hypothetical protein [Clostridia bacterium]